MQNIDSNNLQSCFMHIEKVISLIKSKDEAGLSYLYDHYAPALLGVIVRILKSEKAGEEVLQHTFLKIWEKIDTYDTNKGTLFTWMCQIARNTAIDQKRLIKFQHFQNTDTFEEVLHNRKKEFINTDAFDAKKVLDLLDADHKKVLQHVYLQGYSHSQAAEELGIPLGTVKTRIRNAVLKLREVLKNEKGFLISFLLFIFSMLFI